MRSTRGCRGDRGRGTLFSAPSFGRLAVEAGELPGADEDTGEHGPVKAAGVGVAKGRVIAGEQMDAIGQAEFGGMGEAEGQAGGDDLRVQEMGEIGVEGDPAEADDDANAGQSGDLTGEVVAAVADLLRERLVAGRSAAEDGADPGMAEFEAVVAPGGVWLVGEAELAEDGVHEAAGAVAGEGAAGAIGSVSAGSETEDVYPGAWIAEAGTGRDQ